MKRLKLLQNKSIIFDLGNTILGFILIALLIIVVRNPENSKAVMAAFFLGGSMNILNGLKCMQTSKKNGMGMSFFLLGIIIIFIGYVIVNIMP